MWGENDKKTIKGFIMAKDITKVAKQSDGKTFRFSVVSPERTLELEAKNAQQMDEWVEAVEFLSKVCCAALNRLLAHSTAAHSCSCRFNDWLAWQFAQRIKKEREQQSADAAKAVEKQYQQTLRTGEVFRKWPANRNFKKGAHQIRKLISDHQLQSLYWGDHVTNYVKGSLSMSEIIEIEEGGCPVALLPTLVQLHSCLLLVVFPAVVNSDVQFTIYSKGRYLVRWCPT